MQFDVIFIFKWSVAMSERDAFIEALDAMLFENGIVYITTLERNRFHCKDPAPNDALWVKEVMEKNLSCELAPSTSGPIASTALS